MNQQTEPIRVNGYAAATVVAIASAFGMIYVADAITVQTIAQALSVGLFEFAAVAFGIERARAFAWSPASHEIDANARADARERAVEEGPPEDGAEPDAVDLDAITEPWEPDGTEGRQ